MQPAAVGAVRIEVRLLARGGAIVPPPCAADYDRDVVGRFSGAGGRAIPSACAGVLGAFLGLISLFPSACANRFELDSVVVDQELALKTAAPHFRMRPPSCSKAASTKPISRRVWRSPIPRRGPLPTPCSARSASSRRGSPRAPSSCRRRSGSSRACRCAPDARPGLRCFRASPQSALQMFQPRPRARSVERAGAPRAGACGDGEGRLQRIAGARASGDGGNHAVTGGAVRPRHRFVENGRSRPQRRAAEGSGTTLPDVPPELVDQVRAAARSTKSWRRRRSPCWSAPGSRGPPSFELAFNLGGAYLVNGDLPRRSRRTISR